MVYLQGGPGFGCQEPQDSPLTRLMISRGYAVLYLDYRGVGLSSPVTAETMPDSVADQFEYLKLFRQDSIVRDLEAVRRCLTKGQSKWSIFGQSFGGFVSLTYLSQHPEGLQEVFITGGLAPISSTPQEVYRKTFQMVRARNVAYYQKFPEDVSVVRRIVAYLWRQRGNAVQLPSGGRLSPRRLLTLGHMFGLHGGLDSVHSTLLRMNLDLEQFGLLSRPTLEQFETYLNFNAAPIYAVLHEAIYCFRKGVASTWAAQQVGQEMEDFRWLSHENHPFDDPDFTTDTNPIYFSGEMIFPFMLDEYPELQRMKDVAEKLALFDQWDELYDEDQLRGNTVPVYAANYIRDMYVEIGLAKETARKVSGIQTFETNTCKGTVPGLLKLQPILCRTMLTTVTKCITTPFGLALTKSCNNCSNCVTIRWTRPPTNRRSHRSSSRVRQGETQ